MLKVLTWEIKNKGNKIMKKYENVDYIKGAQNLLDTFELKSNDGLVIMSAEANLDYSNILSKAAKDKGFKNILFILLPDALRPITKIPDILHNILDNSKAMIVSFDRHYEEIFTFMRPLSELCRKKRVRHVVTLEPSEKYFKEGIGANYMVVKEKTEKLKEIIKESENIEVISELGTNLKFEIYKDIAARTPFFDSGDYRNQAPEGELMTCPVEETFNGKLIVDGPITGMGKPPKEPTELEFKNGQIAKVKGNEDFIVKLLNKIQISDKRVKTLKGAWVGEFAIGTNEWAKLDYNLSNCEKVAGAIHIAFGKTCGASIGNFLGEDRGETFHIDNIATNCTITVNKKNGEKVIVVKSGKLLI